MRREPVHQDMRGDTAVREESDARGGAELVGERPDPAPAGIWDDLAAAFGAAAPDVPCSGDRAAVPPAADATGGVGPLARDTEPTVRSSGQVAHSSGPVFVDASGRRSRTWRRAGVITALVCSCYATTVVATLIGGDSSAPFLELPRAMGMTREKAPSPSPEAVGGVSDAAPQDGVTQIPYGEWPKATGWTPEPDATTSSGSAGIAVQPSAEGRPSALPGANAPTAARGENPAVTPMPPKAAGPSAPPTADTPAGAEQSAPPRTGGAASGSATAPAGGGGPKEEAPSGDGTPEGGPLSRIVGGLLGALLGS
ncbi:hypothetical protein [Streptomyces sp. NPDC048462]|uniref:hypothetical protein n=1 Tax=Streptomyces sp. NPDC048462 TaxID=3365555 RepID=UPI003711B8CF